MSIDQLLAALDTSIPDPVRLTDKPFLMPIEGVKLSDQRHSPIAFTQNGRFAAREGSKTVGSGVVTNVIG